MSRALSLIALILSVSLASAAQPPSLFILDGVSLAASRDRAAAGEQPFAQAVAGLRAQAEALLTQGPWSVMGKETVPPSGDKHDYMSQSPYWWPNPDTPDGLPYVEHDGLWNPECDRMDRQSFGTVAFAVPVLAQAWYFTGDERYAARAALLLRTWFLDPATRMNPHLNFAQGVPGRATGTFWGIIDSHSLAPLPDAVTLLQGSAAWTEADRQGMTDWFSAYLDWLLTSVPGRAERAAGNNHGTWYDVQVVALARFCGRDDEAGEALDRSVVRMDYQFDPEGRQPLELRRTKPLHYCWFNLRAWFDLACLAEPLGVDLWSAESGEGQTLRSVLDWILPYWLGQAQLPEADVVTWEPARVSELLQRAARRWPDGPYAQALRGLPGLDDATRARDVLLWPAP